MRQTTTLVGLTAGAALLGTGLLGLSSANATAPDPSTSEGVSSGRLCTEALPKIEARVGDRVARIQGDADTKGSIAFLQARIERAASNGNQASADLLQVRLDHRTQRLELIGQSQQNLEEWEATYCGTAG